MASTAEYRFRFTESYLDQALLRHRETIWWRRHYLALGFALGMIFAMAVGISYLSRARTAMVAAGGGLGAVVGVLLLARPIDRWAARRRLRAAPFHNNELVYRISMENVHVSGTNEDVHFKWSAFSKARGFPDGLLLFQGPHAVNWLPDTAAVDESSILEAKRIARDRIMDYRDV